MCVYNRINFWGPNPLPTALHSDNKSTPKDCPLQEAFQRVQGSLKSVRERFEGHSGAEFFCWESFKQGILHFATPAGLPCLFENSRMNV